MSILRAVNKSLLQTPDGPATFIDPREYRSQLSDMFSMGDGLGKAFCFSGLKSSLKAYEQCAPLTAIINRKAQAHINGKIWLLNKDGKESQNEQAKKLRKLLAKPNPLQTWKQFEAQRKIFVQLFGYCPVLPIIPAGFEKYGPIEASSIWNIPPTILDIEESNKLFYQSDISGILNSVKLRYKGETTELKDKGIFFFKDFTPSFSTMVLPETRIKALELSINNIIGAMESRNVLINYRGALGIISSDSDKAGYVPIKPDDKENLQADFKRYGLKSQQWKFIITSALVKWQQIGIPTKDLMLIEEVIEGSKTICDAYGYPPHLLGLIDPTFNNQKAAEEGLYQNTIIPEAESSAEEYGMFFRLSEYGITFDIDFKHLPILQKDKVNEATARKTLDEALQIEYAKGLITLDDWLVEIGKDPLPGGIGQVRATDPGNSTVPLAVTIGVGGVQGLIAVLTAQGLADDARQSILEVVFGVAPTDASRMVVTVEPTQTGTANTTA